MSRKPLNYFSETFEVLPDHIKLLKASVVEFYSNSYEGGFSQDIKRPYGNSDVREDIKEILDTDDWQYCDLLHQQLAKVLEIVLVTEKFEPGLYRVDDKYTHPKKWYKVNE